MRRVRVTLAIAAALGLAGCVDFGDPVIPNRATPAVLQANMRAFDHGAFLVDGSLHPGRDTAGFQRVVQSPFIQAGDFIVEPRTLGAMGVRAYNSTFPIARNVTAGPFAFVAPDVRDAGTLPPVRWLGLRRLDPDTLFLPRGADVVLRMDTLPEPSDPPNRSRQWFLDIRSGNTSFRISADGPPPASLRIPSDFIPPAPDNHAIISMIYFQSASLRSTTGAYIGNIVLDVRLTWNISFRPTP